jgi:hypothetical protein
MIDTDRYENITPERWTVDEDDPCRVVDVQDCTIARTDFVDIEEEREWQLANAQLIADAPLLLEAYKRLSEKIWIFTDEHHVEHEFSDPYEMMKYMWHHYIEDDVKIAWTVKKND